MTKLALSVSLTLFSIISFGQTKFKPDENSLAHSSRAFNYYNEKKYLQSAMSYDSLFKQNHGEGLKWDKYNAACSWTLAGNIEKGFFYLNKAVADNWTNISHITSDSDLRILHTDKRWQPLIDRIKLNKDKAEAKLNKPLVALLDTIFNEDQVDRVKIDSIQKATSWNSKPMDSLWKRISYYDSVNLNKIKNIINMYGWLGPEEVGPQGSNTVFLVIQHADSLTQVQYLSIMKEAVTKGKAEGSQLALLEDRILTKQGKEQIYGSQLRTNPNTGKYEFFPIKDEINVNKRRASVGLGSLQDYAKNFGVEYVLPTKKAFK